VLKEPPLTDIPTTSPDPRQGGNIRICRHARQGSSSAGHDGAAVIASAGQILAVQHTGLTKGPARTSFRRSRYFSQEKFFNVNVAFRICFSHSLDNNSSTKGKKT